MIYYINKVKELFWTLFYYIFARFIFDELGKGCYFEGWIDITQRHGCIQIGNFVRIRKNVEFTVPINGVLTIGESSFIGSGVVISAQGRVSIGSECLIAEYVCIHDNNHISAEINRAIVSQGFDVGSCVIGNGCWIGAGSIILMNSSLGENSILAAGSVLTKVLPDHIVAAGVPARIIRNRTSFGMVVEA